MEKPAATKGFAALGGQEDDDEIQGEAIDEEVVEEFDDWSHHSLALSQSQYPSISRKQIFMYIFIINASDVMEHFLTIPNSI